METNGIQDEMVMNMVLIHVCRNDYLVIGPQFLRQFHADLMRDLRRYLARFEALVAVERENAVFLTKHAFD